MTWEEYPHILADKAHCQKKIANRPDFAHTHQRPPTGPENWCRERCRAPLFDFFLQICLDTFWRFLTFVTWPLSAGPFYGPLNTGPTFGWTRVWGTVSKKKLNCGQRTVSLQKLPPFPSKAKVKDRKGTPKRLCHKDFPQLSGEVSGVICLKSLVSFGGALESFRNFFGAVRVMFWLCGSCLNLERGPKRKNLKCQASLVRWEANKG